MDNLTIFVGSATLTLNVEVSKKGMCGQQTARTETDTVFSTFLK